MSLESFPILYSKRLILRQINQKDIHDVFKGLSHPEVIKYYGVSYNSLEETQSQINWYKELEYNKTGIYWAICSVDNLVFYGIGGLNNLDQKNKTSELGFSLLPEFWNKGFMKEAFPLICDYAFNILHLHRIEGFVDSRNIACKKAIEKMSFIFEGSMRDCEIKDDQFLSVDIYSRLKTD